MKQNLLLITLIALAFNAQASDRDNGSNSQSTSNASAYSSSYAGANAICHCFNPSDAKWIASRLNLASKLEQMTYDFATGKTDGEELVRFVRESIDA